MKLVRCKSCSVQGHQGDVDADYSHMTWMQHRSDRSCLRFPHVEFWDLTDWRGKTTFEWICFKRNLSDGWFLPRCYVCVSVSCRVCTPLACASSLLLWLPQQLPISPRHRSMSQLHCAAVLWWTCCQVKARLSPVSQASPRCVQLTFKRLKTRSLHPQCWSCDDFLQCYLGFPSV